MKHSRFLVISLFAGAIFTNVGFAKPLGNHDGHFDQATRVQIIEDLCRGLKSRYAGWSLKKRTTVQEGYFEKSPILWEQAQTQTPVANGEDLCEEAISRERQIPDPERTDSIEQTLINVEFPDRVLKLSAGFRDGHLNFNPMIQNPKLSLGMELEWVQGKVRLTQMDKSTYLTQKIFLHSIPEIGAELIEWNHEPIEKEIKRLSQYISASSERSLIHYTVMSLTERDFSFPRSTTVTLTFRNSDGKKVEADYHWLVSSNRDIELPSAYEKYFNHFKISVAPGKKPKEDVKLPIVLNGKTVVLSKEQMRPKRTEVKTREYHLPNHMETLSITRAPKFIAIRMNDFINEPIHLGSVKFKDIFLGRTDQQEDKLQVIAKTLQRASDDQAIIFDLRKNRGGSFLLSLALSLNLVKKGEKPILPGIVKPKNLSNLRQMGLEFDLSDPSPYLPDEFQSLGKLEGTNQRNPKIHLLIGPQCSSACEGFAHIVQVNRLGKLWGLPTHGTGMGYSTEHSQGNSILMDSFGVFTSESLPNFLLYTFQTPSQKQGAATPVTHENKPVIPDAWRDYSFQDLIDPVGLYENIVNDNH